MTDAIHGSDLDEVRLEELAARETPSPMGAHWVALQAAEHLLASTSPRDPLTGRPRPVMLRHALKSIRQVLDGGARPLPLDAGQRALDLCLEAVDNILREPRTNIVRQHEMRPLHAVREMDEASMRWLARQPGRTAKEKLAGQRRAKAVVRKFSVDTLENRVVRRVVQELRRYVEQRLDAADAYTDGMHPSIKELEDALRLLRMEFQRSELASLSPSYRPQPTNVLLDDRNYSRVWRAYQMLLRRDDVLAKSWPRVGERTAAALFWSFVARLANQQGVQLWEGPILLRDPGDDMMALRQSSSSLSWGDQPKVTFLLENDLDRNERGRIKTIISRTGQPPFGFIERQGGEDVYFNEDSLTEREEFLRLAEGQEVCFRLGQRRSKSKSSPAVELERSWDPRRLQLDVHLQGRTITVNVRQLESTGLSAAPAVLCAQYKIKPCPPCGEPALGRGLPYAICRGRKSNSWSVLSGFADVLGFREGAEFLVQDVLWCNLGPTFEPSPKAAVPSHSLQPELPLGLDLGTSRPHIYSGGSKRTQTHAVGVRRDLPQAEVIWTVEASQSPALPPGKLGQYIPFTEMFDTESGSVELAHAYRAGRAVADQLAGELGEDPTRPVGVAIPDTVDAISRSRIQNTMSQALGQSFPVWRSVAAATGWQADSELEIEEGDLVLVVDAEAPSLTMTPLVARYDQELKAATPGSGGILWERRPSLAATDTDDVLTYKQIQLDYAEQLLKNHEIQSRSELAHQLVVSGRIEQLLEEGEIVTATDRDGEWWLVLEHRSNMWKRLLSSWLKLFWRRFSEVLASRTMRELFRDINCEEPTELLLVGRPFHIETKLTTYVGRHEIHLAEASCCIPGSGAVALGAAQLAERREAGLPTWQDWLQNMAVEVIRDGHYEILPLIADAQRGIAAGETIAVDVPTEFLSPATSSSCVLPMVDDEETRRSLGVEGRVRLDKVAGKGGSMLRGEFSYKHGIERSWEMVLHSAADDGSMRFSASWHTEGTAGDQFSDREFWVPPHDGHQGASIKSVDEAVRIFDRIEEAVACEEFDTRHEVWKLKDALGDGHGERRELVDRMLELLHRWNSGDGFDPALSNAAIGALGTAIWHNAELVNAVADSVEELFHRASRSLSNVLARLPELIEEVSEGKEEREVLRKYESPYENACRLLLGLFRLRSTDTAKFLTPGRPQLVRLARVVRRIDSLLVGAGRRVRVQIPFPVEVPTHLHRISELGYATSCYLAGYEEPLLRVDC